MEDNVRQRVKLFLENNNLSENTLAKAIDVSQVSLNRWLKSTPMPALFIHKILNKYPNLSAEWLLRGTEPMYLPADSQTDNKSFWEKIVSSLPNCGDEQFYEEQLEEKDRVIRSLSKEISRLQTVIESLQEK